MNCADCYFGRKPGEAFNNSCHRNPLPVYASTAHWCGEHKPIETKVPQGYEGAHDPWHKVGRKPVLSLPKRK